MWPEVSLGDEAKSLPINRAKRAFVQVLVIWDCECLPQAVQNAAEFDMTSPLIDSFKTKQRQNQDDIVAR